jgi:hypothetical protein
MDSFVQQNAFHIIESPGSGHFETLSDFSSDEREYFEERAAIYEFEAGLQRDEAEMKALEAILIQRYQLSKAG